MDNCAISYFECYEKNESVDNPHDQPLRISEVLALKGKQRRSVYRVGEVIAFTPMKGNALVSISFGTGWFDLYDKVAFSAVFDSLSLESLKCLIYQPNSGADHSDCQLLKMSFAERQSLSCIPLAD